MNGRGHLLLATHGNYEKKFGPFIRHLSGRKTEKIASFNRARQGNFFQDAPQHQNPFTGDPFLQRCLKRYLSTNGKLTLFVARGDKLIIRMHYPVFLHPPKQNLDSFDPQCVYLRPFGWLSL